MQHNGYNVLMKWSDWITNKYIEWRGNRIGPLASINEFARELGIPQSVMSRWMKDGGTKPTKGSYISNLAFEFGPELYEVLGLPVPAPISDIDLSGLPRPLKKQMKAAIDEINLELNRLHLDPKSDDVFTLTIKTLDKYGFTYRHTTNLPD
jgi:hypothetical protein